MKKKIMSLCLIVCLLATAVIGGTLAYFTDVDEADNVFTVGNIDIELHEAEETGTYQDDDYRDWLKGQTIMPGQQLDKIVWVENTGNQPAYVRVTITVPEGMEAVWGADLGAWSRSPAEGTGAGVYVYTNTTPLAAGAVTPWLLTDMKLSETVTELNVQGEYNVNVKVEAIQSAGLTSDEAYAELDKEDNGNVAAKVATANITEVNDAMSSGNVVVQLTDNMTANAAIALSGDVLDGNGNTFTKTPSNAKINAGVQPTGGTIKNITISGESQTYDGDGKSYSFRAVYMTQNLTSDLIIENAVLNGSYAINNNSKGVDEYGLTVTNSKLNGWVSYGNLKGGATFVNCDFSGGEFGYDTLKPCCDTVLTACRFTEGYTFAAAREGKTFELNNCSVGTEKVTAENFAALFTLGGDEIKSCSVIVDGVSVVFPG